VEPEAAVDEPEAAADEPEAAADEPEAAADEDRAAIDGEDEEGEAEPVAENDAEEAIDEKFAARQREAAAEAERLAAAERHEPAVEHANKAMAHASAHEEPAREIPPAPVREIPPPPVKEIPVVEPLAANKRHAQPVPPSLPVPAGQGRVEAEGEAPGEVVARSAVPADLVQPAPADPADVETAQNPDGVKLAMKTYQTVRVQPGETVSEIAVRNYGQASPTILDMMKIANPSIRNIDVIAVGQSLELPQLDEGFVVIQQGGGYSLLLMSTPIQQRANEIEAALRQHGFQARVKRADFGSGQTVSRVMVGGLPNRDAALDVGKRLQKLFREDERIAAMAR
jgi:LysM repeat protein